MDPTAGDLLDQDFPVIAPWIGQRVGCRVGGGSVLLRGLDTGREERLSVLWFVRRQGRMLRFEKPEFADFAEGHWGWDGSHQIHFADTATAERVARRMRWMTEEAIADVDDLTRLRRQSWEAAQTTSLPGWAGGLITPRMIGGPPRPTRSAVEPAGWGPVWRWLTWWSVSAAVLLGTGLLIVLGIDVVIALPVGALGLTIALGVLWICALIGWDPREERRRDVGR